MSGEGLRPLIPAQLIHTCEESVPSADNSIMFLPLNLLLVECEMTCANDADVSDATMSDVGKPPKGQNAFEDPNNVNRGICMRHLLK